MKLNATTDITQPGKAAEMWIEDDEAYEFNAPADTIERARSYISKLPEAVSGDGGHNATFAVACKLVQGFGLDYDDALNLLIEYNERCDPPWSLAELEHKIKDALAQPVDHRGEAYLLNANPEREQPKHPSISDRRPFLPEDIFALAKLRRIQPHAIKLVAEMNFLFRTTWHDVECFGVTDSSGLLIELRRMDGQPFPPVPDYNLGERKSHAIRGSKKSWPLGLLEADEFPCIALVEGVPDFLYAHLLVLNERARKRVAVVGMLSASPRICPEALPHFAGKRVRIYPHLDAAGLLGARVWQQQLNGVGATKVDMFDFSGLVGSDGTPIQDLCDLTKLTPTQLEADQSLRRILP